MYELFEDLLKQLIVARPENPLQFLLQKIKMSQGKSKSRHSLTIAFALYSPPRFLAWCPWRLPSREPRGFV